MRTSVLARSAASELILTTSLFSIEIEGYFIMGLGIFNDFESAVLVTISETLIKYHPTTK